MNPFADLADVACELCGAEVLEANDEFFAEKENLIRAEPAVFLPGKYTDRGKWMDGWESRRKRTEGFDWCVVRLGFPAALHAMNVDTSHFTGNFPSHCSLDARLGAGEWMPVLAKMRLQGGSHNLFELPGTGPFDQVRLNIYPDGGVARLRVYGRGMPDWNALEKEHHWIDLAAAAHGGLALAASDAYFGARNNLILPGRPKNMGGGWETRRRRGPGYDWIIVQLGAPGLIHAVQVETEHYKGNFPDSCSVDGCAATDCLTEDLVTGQVPWRSILGRSVLGADAIHRFESELRADGPISHVRLKIYPDGGISRLRVLGSRDLAR